MPHTARDDALLALNRLQQRLVEVSSCVMPETLIISFSAGVAASAPEEAIDAAIERTDHAMYRAKTGAPHAASQAERRPARPDLRWRNAGALSNDLRMDNCARRGTLA